MVLVMTNKDHNTFLDIEKIVEERLGKPKMHPDMKGRWLPVTVPLMALFVWGLLI